MRVASTAWDFMQARGTSPARGVKQVLGCEVDPRLWVWWHTIHALAHLPASCPI